jgi:hypothetical protein
MHLMLESKIALGVLFAAFLAGLVYLIGSLPTRR